MWIDMHQHTGFAPHVQSFTQGLACCGVTSLCATVTPQEYAMLTQGGVCLSTVSQEAGCGNAALQQEGRMNHVARSAALQNQSDVLPYVGVGLHPWWIADGRCGATDIEMACRQIHGLYENNQARIVAEIGLDFSRKWMSDPASSKDRQIAACRTLFSCTQTLGDKPWVFSLHSVKADDVLLDIVEAHRHAVAELSSRNDIVIMHSFGGSSEHLMRAAALGCYFSIGPRMMRTKRGREYAKAIPVHRMLLETDLPACEGTEIAPETIVLALSEVCEMIEQIRGCSVREEIYATSSWILDQVS